MPLPQSPRILTSHLIEYNIDLNDSMADPNHDEHEDTSSSFTNSSAYKFVVLGKEDLPVLKQKLVEEGHKHGLDVLRGTILLSCEGVNIRLSGSHSAIASMQKAFADIDARLADIEFKDSISNRLTLTRFLVHLKREVISMGVDNVRPAIDGLAEHISALDFKEWLDQDKDMLVLDTRNDYEVRLGSFEKAVDLNIKSFRSFPDAAKTQLASVPKHKPVVMFCTGGVRCEKAAYCLKEQGFESVYQLDGGIIKYFEKCGGRHYTGDCFIFDDRVALDADLKETQTRMCFVCRSPVTLEEQTFESYVPNVSCLNCINGSKNDFRAAEAS